MIGQRGRRISRVVGLGVTLGAVFWAGKHLPIVGLTGILTHPAELRSRSEAWSVTHPLELAMLSVIAGAWFLPLFKWASNRLAPPTMLQSVFKGDEAIRLAMSKMAVNQFDSLRFSVPVNLPSNTPLLPMGDALALALLAETAKALPGDTRSVLIRDEIWPANSFVSIGGPLVNADAAQVHDRIPNYTYNVGTETFCFEGHSYTAVRSSRDTTKHSPLLLDYGFMVLVASADSKRHLYLWGIWPPGTHAAAETFLSDFKLGVMERY
jgi:hypothetical protein